MTISHNSLPEGYRPDANLLSQRVILVTGAGQGLGKVAALAFAQHGASVILHGKSLAKLEVVYDQIADSCAPKAAILPLDFLTATQAELDGFAHSIHGNFGRLDGIFHAASHLSPLTPLALHALDSWQRHWQVNVAVPAALTKACLPMLLRAADARVVFLTETHAVDPRPFWGPFALAKGVLPNAAEMWQSELPADTPLRFRVCLPGPVASPMRAISHPAEARESLLPAESLVPHFLYLMGPDSRSATRTLHYCQP
ncbi:MAG: SDR family NAD(P)-dependent oxidoreductase [Betaproteobacteria bacterium]|nr:SDR family NAD(P)-dependent oxidoreductase [Betaproteobacteria bacterium]